MNQPKQGKQKLDNGDNIKWNNDKSIFLFRNLFLYFRFKFLSSIYINKEFQLHLN